MKALVLVDIQKDFKAHFIEDASRGVNLQPDDVENAIAEMNRGGIAAVRSSDILKIK